MKISAKKLKQIIKEELESVVESGKTMFPRPEPYRGGQSGGGVGVPGEFAAAEQKYVMAFSMILGISPEEAAAIPPEEIGEMALQIRQAYQHKKMDAPPLNEPRGGWKDPFTGQ
jgi:hypothetical protein